MNQDAFERLNQFLNQVEALPGGQADPLAIAAIRIGADILERVVTALERIAANTAPPPVTISTGDLGPICLVD